MRVTVCCSHGHGLIPIIPVPITLQSAGAMLAGTLLGRRWGFISDRYREWTRWS
ncbi:biotin transporter BioY [Sporosarcina psychrophila]|uniref:biotin transporter BioY n=1 Tax=Sporosarcina psychrophila TaxID=1476 RepID=UPI003BAE36BB